MAENIVEWRTMPARPAQTAPFPAELHPHLVRGLQQIGIRTLYSHQLAAWQKAQAGDHLVIVTGTASGKSLCYQLPILDRLLRQPEARALYLFPTKALTQDQLASLQAIRTGLPAAIYDGDTPEQQRSAIRRTTRLLLTNPDMLHLGILPHHTAWADFFRNLQFVVIDEIHVYRGVFGSHVANVLRRLRRVSRFYGSDPQYFLTSATIANPLELGTRLIPPGDPPKPVSLIDEDGSPRGPRTFLIYNPPVVDQSLGLRRSVLQESLRLAEDLLSADLQTVVFGRSRRTVELLLSFLLNRTGTKDAFYPAWETEEPSASELTPQVRGYRSGYLPRQRRQIERGLRQGQVRMVIATNALELGVDIGGMEAALLVGYPGSIAATWQQAGRAGRKEAASLAVLVASADPLDQFLAAHPEYFFGRSPEHALIDPDNLLLLLAHLRCAAFELPFESGESFGALSPAQLQEILELLVSEGTLHRTTARPPGKVRYFWMADRYPAQEVPLRSLGAENITLLVQQRGQQITLGEVDYLSACWMVHPQAIYLHEAQTYRVTDLNLEERQAILEPVQVDYYTEPRQEASIELLEQTLTQPIPGGQKGYGQIRLTSQVVGYKMIAWETRETLGFGEVHLPPSELVTSAYWLTLAPEVVDRLRLEGLWRNDPNDYGPNWAAQRELARRRDHFRCQLCGTPEQGQAHHVHHKTPFRLFTSYREANVLENLITLCPACHRRVEAAVRIRSGLAGLGYVLGHLAPFSLMCDVHDLGVHSDPQCSFAGGQPTVVLYDRVPAGIGLSRRLYDLHAEVLSRARSLVEACPCADGCPSCVGPGGENGQGGKLPTLAILQSLCNEAVI